MKYMKQAVTVRVDSLNPNPNLECKSLSFYLLHLLQRLLNRFKISKKEGSGFIHSFFLIPEHCAS
jgi:hypothetical protein